MTGFSLYNLEASLQYISFTQIKVNLNLVGPLRFYTKFNKMFVS